MRWRVGRQVRLAVARIGAAALSCLGALAAQAPTLAASGPTAPPAVSAQSAVVYAPQTGQVLYGKAPALRLPPASTTKVLTAIVVLEHVRNLDAKVRITAGEAYVGGSSAPMAPGEEMTVRDLLYGLLLVSGNNAAVALATYTSGSVPRFVALMNATARELGADHSHFVNPNGLPAAGHLVTALDLARIAAAAVRLPEFVRIASTEVLENYPMPTGPPQPMVNQDQLLWNFPGIVAGKIGYTSAAGNTMVAVARRGGRELVAVVLRDVPWAYWNDETALLDYGFSAYRTATVVPAGLRLGRRAVAGMPHRYAALITTAALTREVPAGSHLARAIHLVAPRRLPAGRRAGTVVGRLVVTLGGRSVGQVPVALLGPTPRPAPPARRTPWARDLVAGALVLFGAVVWVRGRRRQRLGRRVAPRRRYRLRRPVPLRRVAGGR